MALRDFLDLPAEIRNTIYSYALAADIGVKYVAKRHAFANSLRGEYETHGRLYSLDSGKTRPKFTFQDILRAPRNQTIRTPKFNQLQFVDRQLYAETRNLMMQYNDLTATNEHFLHLIQNFPAAYYKDLRVMKLTDNLHVKVIN